MNYFIKAKTEVGLKKGCNQDSLIMIKANFRGKEVCIAVLCDGMGGLSCGEFASKSITEAFSDWFSNQYTRYEKVWMPHRLGKDFGDIVSSENEGLIYYGTLHGIRLGTTLTAIFLAEDNFLACHVGDTRLYKISKNGIAQLTRDHTVIAREMSVGRLTAGEAKKDPRRNVLLQCIGATKQVKPDIFTGKVKKGDIFLLCSDGFRHEISEKEIFQTLINCDNSQFEKNLGALIDLNLKRKEQDNISVSLIKVQ